MISWKFGDRLPAATASSTRTWITGPFSACKQTMPPCSAVTRMTRKISPSSSIRPLGYAMKSLKDVTPSRSIRVRTSRSASSLTRFRMRCAPMSTLAVSARPRHSSRAAKGVADPWLQKSTMVVVPPNAAALVPEAKVSTVRAVPNSQSRWVWTSTPPGKTRRPLASWTSTSRPADKSLPTERIVSPSHRMSAT